MSTIRANTITNSAGTGAPVFSQGIKSDTITDSAGGNAATINGITPADAALVGIKSSTSVASTSGTAIDFTGIPSWAKRVTVIFNGVSLSGTDNILVQLGSSGGIVSTGYNSSCQNGSAGSGSSTAGFLANLGGNAANSLSGIMTITNPAAGVWIYNWLGKQNAGNVSFGGGDGTIVGALDRIRVTSVAGANTFDAGTINITWE